jgi:hypothetical protein
MAAGETIQVGAGLDVLDDASALPSLPSSAEMSPVELAARDRRMSDWSDPQQPRPNPHNPARFGELAFVK